MAFALACDLLSSTDRASLDVAVLCMRLTDPGAAVGTCFCRHHFFLPDSYGYIYRIRRAAETVLDAAIVSR